ncbi:uncharacterized protein LOC127285392 [Leptopilina boulardi]|uniref:uncharacterized protein LOC127285392 n=1 Tax=Leptopilina boulardi TaxID=63433 RepID=UPI0021F64830|nr:uncharacterized protein LOC127285392 [Leptopilina boulardi]
MLPSTSYSSLGDTKPKHANHKKVIRDFKKESHSRPANTLPSTSNYRETKTNRQEDKILPSTLSSSAERSKHKEEENRSKLILKKLTEIDIKLSTSNDGSLMNSKKLNIFGQGDLKMFPAKILNEMVDIEKKLKSKRFRNTVMDALELLGKEKSVSLIMRNMMDQLLTYELGQAYTFHGKMYNKQKKPAFKSLRLNSVIYKAAMKLDINRADAKSGITEWLNQAKNYNDRFQASLEKQREIERLANLDESSLSEADD